MCLGHHQKSISPDQPQVVDSQIMKLHLTISCWGMHHNGHVMTAY